MFREKISISDRLEIYHYRNGELIDRRITEPKGFLGKIISKLYRFFRVKKYTHDLVTNVGKADIASELTTMYTHIAIGTDDGTSLPLDATNTTLGNEIQRLASTNSLKTTNVTNDTAVFEATFSFADSYAIQESGIFDAASDGTMLCRQTFPAMNVESGDSIKIVWNITVS